MIDYSQYNSRKAPVKREKAWLCNDCGKRWNYAMQIWGSPDRPCQWCGAIGVLIKLYREPLKPKSTITPDIEISVG